MYYLIQSRKVGSTDESRWSPRNSRTAIGNRVATSEQLALHMKARFEAGEEALPDYARLEYRVKEMQGNPQAWMR